MNALTPGMGTVSVTVEEELNDPRGVRKPEYIGMEPLKEDPRVAVVEMTMTHPVAKVVTHLMTTVSPQEAVMPVEGEGAKCRASLCAASLAVAMDLLRTKPRLPATHTRCSAAVPVPPAIRTVVLILPPVLLADCHHHHHTCVL